MKTLVVTFRLEPDSPAGQVYSRWLTEGYQARKIMEYSLLALEGKEPPTINGALGDLQSVVDRLESVVQNIQNNGGIISREQQQSIDEALDPKFLNGMKRLVRPGFSKKPTDE